MSNRRKSGLETIDRREGSRNMRKSRAHGGSPIFGPSRDRLLPGKKRIRARKAANSS